MLRSLFSGISGLRAHQTMLDVTGNNIANVNTTGFKASQTQFQDTLSQVLTNAGAAQDGVGGTNPAQVGLGVRVAGITTNFQQGAAQLTNRSTDMMISGDGFFVVRKGTEQLYTRAGAFDFDATGQLVTPDGGLVQGWAADAAGNIDTNGQLVDLRLPIATLMGAAATTSATFEGNLPSEAAVGTTLNRDVDVYAADGTVSTLALAFTRTAAGWDVSGAIGATNATGSMTFNADGTQATGGSLTVGGVTVDLSTITGFAGLDTVEASTQNGRAAGTLQSFTINADGTLLGSFSNGLKQALGRVALSTFTNPAGMEKAGGSLYRTTVNSGDAQIGAAGTGGRGDLTGGALEMSNVDLSAEFTNLIIAQRGFQANSRVITTSDELLQELVNLKR
ncbi:flagellar hook protein FlgE [Actinotalea fermentans]|uniref:Flagellar hook protein FlgE n=1 Tax=Actinotalea fermentans TaxID=43671 RepID=A0A511YZI1_9CELL|nr:flagellar hook protein FlgE [Actinotalea fermentans]KGM15796.1 flagellar hook protein [Actinotalea fermentans ATCC 43279 = JCM 9966 = DSM 3133]GEN80620.1 flagellar hook protein FlgE [Actinotalea fermentans]